MMMRVYIWITYVIENIILVLDITKYCLIYDIGQNVILDEIDIRLNMILDKI